MKLTSKIIFALLMLIVNHSIFAALFTEINSPVANLYSEPNAKVAPISQAIYGSKVDVSQNNNGWSQVRTDDNYEGWMPTELLGKISAKSRASYAKVISNFAFVYAETDDTLHSPLLMLPYSALLPIKKIKDKRWIEVYLVGGGTGWIQQGDVRIDAEPMSIPDMLISSKQFIGLPYLWAGASTYGFDCSGFVQMLYRELGIIIPRDANFQVIWPRFIEVKREEIIPGDIMYFGWDDVISHAAIYLGDNKFINSTAHINPRVQISDLRDKHWDKIFITARRLDPAWPNLPEFQSSIEPIPSELQDKMRTHTWRPGCPATIDSLAFLQLSYWGFDGKTHLGSMIASKQLAPEIVDIFHELYLARFPIEKMQPIEEYDGDDNRSMADNNTSAFNCRAMTDFPDQYSVHSYGAAIDINPLINPYTNGKKIEPKAGAKYLDRNTYHLGKITTYSPAYKAFTKRGWIWGGGGDGGVVSNGDKSWNKKIKDYQHFEKRSEV